jgi:hypothetical protein
MDVHRNHGAEVRWEGASLGTGRMMMVMVMVVNNCIIARRVVLSRSPELGTSDVTWN